MKISNRIYKVPSNNTFTMLIGLPGVGKSSFAELILQKDSQNRTIISSDNIRLGLLNYEETKIDHDPELEPKVWGIIKKQVKNALSNPDLRECILDATNTRRSGRKEFIIMARSFGFKTRAIVLYAPLDEILRENSSRKRIVSENVIKEFYLKFQEPTKNEFDEIFKIGSKRKFKRFQRAEQSKTIKLKIDGHDVMKILNITPSEKVGMVLNYLQEKVMEGTIKNKRKLLLELCINEFVDKNNLDNEA